MFAGFEDNNEILAEAQNFRLILQKVQIPILTQVNNSLHVSYYLYKYNAVTFDFITNIMTDEADKLPENVPNIQSSRVDTKGGQG